MTGVDAVAAGSQPKFTVVIPTFNGIETLDMTFESLERQTVNNFLILIVDDGSTDETVALVRKRLRRQDRLCCKSRSGLYHTLNFALEKVETDWVVLLFQDDELDPRYFEDCDRLVGGETSAHLIWFAIDTIDRNSRLLRAGTDSCRVELIEPGVTSWRSALFRGTFWTISGSLSRTSTLRRLQFRADLPHCGDYEILLRALREVTMCYIETPRVSIRQHVNQASTRNIARASDLAEKICVIEESTWKHRGDLETATLVALALTHMGQVALRMASFLKCGRVGAAMRLLGQLGRLALLPVRGLFQ